MTRSPRYCEAVPDSSFRALGVDLGELMIFLPWLFRWTFLAYVALAVIVIRRDFWPALNWFCGGLLKPFGQTRRSGPLANVTNKAHNARQKGASARCTAWSFSLLPGVIWRYPWFWLNPDGLRVFPGLHCVYACTDWPEGALPLTAGA